VAIDRVHELAQSVEDKEEDGVLASHVESGTSERDTRITWDERVKENKAREEERAGPRGATCGDK